jgi:hypothetical protein
MVFCANDNFVSHSSALSPLSLALLLLLRRQAH